MSILHHPGVQALLAIAIWAGVIGGFGIHFANKERKRRLK